MLNDDTDILKRLKEIDTSTPNPATSASALDYDSIMQKTKSHLQSTINTQQRQEKLVPPIELVQVDALEIVD
jgi:hypothetical protein